MKNRIAELEKQVTGNKTYKLGDTLNVFENGLLLYSITFERTEQDTHSIDSIFYNLLFVTFKNYSVPVAPLMGEIRPTVHSLNSDGKILSSNVMSIGNKIVIGESYEREISYEKDAVKLIFSRRSSPSGSGGYNLEPFAIFEF